MIVVTRVDLCGGDIDELEQMTRCMNWWRGESVLVLLFVP